MFGFDSVRFMMLTKVCTLTHEWVLKTADCEQYILKMKKRSETVKVIQTL